MTENKRFTVKQRQGATNYSIRDYYGELPLSEGMYYKSNAEKLCKWLNTQHELLDTLYNENVQLKQFIKELTTKGTGRIDLANGYSYNVNTVLTGYRGDVE